jgi:hypothetical protein
MQRVLGIGRLIETGAAVLLGTPRAQTIDGAIQRVTTPALSETRIEARAIDRSLRQLAARFRSLSLSLLVAATIDRILCAVLPCH